MQEGTPAWLTEPQRENWQRLGGQVQKLALDVRRKSDFENARDRGVVFVKGSDFLIKGGQNALRIAFSGVTPAEIDEGVSRLAEAYRGLADAAA